jgi:hypothetical protein
VQSSDLDPAGLIIPSETLKPFENRRGFGNEDKADFILDSGFAGFKV